MKYILFTFCLIFIVFSCSESFDMKSYDNMAIKDYNAIIENIGVFEDMISYDALTDSMMMSQFKEQGSALQTSINKTIATLDNAELPEEYQEYKNSLLNVYHQLLNLTDHDMKFISFTKDSEFAIDSFAIVHDKMNVEVNNSIDSFNIVRNNILIEEKE